MKCARCWRPRDRPDRTRCAECRYYDSQRTLRLKQEVFLHYGEICGCCGEDFLDFLQLDHIYEDGAAERRISPSGQAFYAKLKREGWPQGRLRVLCANCNMAKALNGGRCPCGRAKLMHISGYPKIHHPGHRELFQLLLDPVVVEEKLDGSQISFGCIDGTLRVRSKSVMLDIDAPDKLFSAGVTVLRQLVDALIPNAVYRGEYLSKPKHNTLAYDRVPKNHIALFDVELPDEGFMSRARLEEEADRIGFETVPRYFVGMLDSLEQTRPFLSMRPVLGGAQIEGVVIKNHRRFGHDDKPLMAKVVTESFRELHSGEWRSQNPTPTDIRQSIGQLVCTPARWAKAVSHLRDAGRLQNAVQDIGPLIQELTSDIDQECRDLIVDKLLAWAMPTVRRSAVRGFPDWYRAQLAAATAEAANDNAGTVDELVGDSARSGEARAAG